MDLCEKCYYLTRTRYGRVCSFDGTYNPHREECPHFLPKEEGERRKKQERTSERLLLEIINRLADLDSEAIKKIPDEELRQELLELRLIAKQFKLQ